MNICTLIWDLGGVLIDWSPLYVFDEHYFGSAEQKKFFFEQVCTSEWNENQDAGYPIAKATEERIALFPEWEKQILDYYGRWEEMLRGSLPESVALFRRLTQNPRIKNYALSNWSAETFPVALKRFDFLHWFDGRVVSGEEKTRKPFPEFYLRLLHKYQVNPAQALFIDDNLRNVEAARELGIYSLHFRSAPELEEKLLSLQLL